MHAAMPQILYLGVKMEKPTGVNQAVIGIWATIVLSSISTLINKWVGDISMDEFVFTIIIYGIVCILPYKISKGSNAARYVYLVFFAISIFFMLAGIVYAMPKLDLILSVLLIPIEIFIIIRLFQPEASAWFSSAT